MGAVHHDAGEEGAEGKGDAKQLDGAKSDAQGTGEDGQGEQLAGAGGGGAGQQPGDEASPADDHQGDEGSHLGQGQADIRHHLGRGQCLAPLLQVGEDGEQYQGQHHHQILHDEPADGDASLVGVELAATLQGAQQHHGTGGGEGQAKHQAGGHGPVEQLGEAKAEQGRKGYLNDGSRDGDVFHRQQVFHGKVQADTKHQQDDADFGQLGGEPQIGDIARRKGAAYHAGREVAHHGGDAQAACQHAEEVGQHEAAYQGGDKGE